MNQRVKNDLKMFYTLLWTHRREKHASRSYDEKEMTTVRFTLYEKKKTTGFIDFNNYIKYV
jgi:hypothetical protein